ncbi:unnamed protein product [Brassica oleracea]
MNHSSTNLLWFSSISEGIESDILASGISYCGILFQVRRQRDVGVLQSVIGISRFMMDLVEVFADVESSWKMAVHMGCNLYEASSSPHRNKNGVVCGVLGPLRRQRCCG